MLNNFQTSLDVSQYYLMKLGENIFIAIFNWLIMSIKCFMFKILGMLKSQSLVYSILFYY